MVRLAIFLVQVTLFLFTFSDPCVASTLYSKRSQSRDCKPVPSSSDWPIASKWMSLNKTVSGALLVPVPVGAVCDANSSTYNSADCSNVDEQWGNTSYHAASPFTVDFNDITCLPQAQAPCSGVGYPSYVIEAQSAKHVQAGVNFARKTGVRLIIKNTGHCYLGRSSGASSLSIWTHNLKGIEISQDASAAKKLGGVAAVKIYAGEQMRNIYAFADDHNLTIVGGSDMDVGVGGYISGGGHSPISAAYGMAADQVLAMEVVTADGKFRSIDADHDSDLFWALRGGGAGTFGVLISVTVKAHPSISVAAYYFSYSTTPNSDTFWAMTTRFHADLPRLAEAGVMGYYYVAPDTFGSNSSTAGTIYGLLIGPDLSVNQTVSIMEPLEHALSGGGLGDDAVYIAASTLPEDNFSSFWAKIVPEASGFSLRLGSRLWNNDTLMGDSNKLEQVLRTSTQPSQEFLGNFVAGPGTHNPPGGIAGGSNAVLPAWRTAYTHVIAPRVWSSLDEASMLNVTTDLRENITPALASVAPGMGSYLNEADPTDPEWQNNFFGVNYARLLRIKKKYDPKGVFWCKNCVGSELWTAVGSYGVENGVGQTDVQLCRNKTAG